MSNYIIKFSSFLLSIKEYFYINSNCYPIFVESEIELNSMNLKRIDLYSNKKLICYKRIKLIIRY